MIIKPQNTYVLRLLFAADAAFGGERGIRTLVRVSANWFRVSPVMTTSISLRIRLSGILRENCELLIMSPARQFREKCRKREIMGEKRRFHSHVCDRPNYVSSQLHCTAINLFVTNIIPYSLCDCKTFCKNSIPPVFWTFFVHFLHFFPKTYCNSRENLLYWR